MVKPQGALFETNEDAFTNTKKKLLEEWGCNHLATRTRVFRRGVASRPTSSSPAARTIDSMPAPTSPRTTPAPSARLQRRNQCSVIT
jgi:hypothetical protein